MKILVTGGAGFIGSNIVKILEKKGVEVVILDNFFSANFKNLKGTKAEVICANIKDEKTFKKIPKVKAVIHEAAITDTTLLDEKEMMEVNYEGFKNVFKFAFKNKIPLVYASSAAVYGDGPSPMKEEQISKPLNIYAYSKYLCDRFVSSFKNTPMPVVGLRYFNVYGPGEFHKKKSASMIYQLYLQMKEGKNPRIFKFGEQKRDFIYVKDVAKITVEALNLKKNIILNVGTGTARSFNEIISILNKCLEKNLSPDYFDNPYKEVYQEYTCADISLLKKFLKIQADFSLEEGISDYIKNIESYL